MENETKLLYIYIRIKKSREEDVFVHESTWNPPSNPPNHERRNENGSNLSRTNSFLFLFLYI